jgi:hypothetical protein
MSRLGEKSLTFAPEVAIVQAMRGVLPRVAALRSTVYASSSDREAIGRNDVDDAGEQSDDNAATTICLSELTPIGSLRRVSRTQKAGAVAGPSCLALWERSTDRPRCYVA